MINKEFIVGSGGIIKDFQDRNIPQNANNFVSVGVLIPVSEFADLGTYGVCLATSKIVGGVETNLPSLICYSAKTLKIEGVDYIKYQCQLSISYTNFIGQLKLTPYIIEIEILNEGEEDENVVITTQKTFTNTTLNVIRSIASTSDASLEESTAEETLTALIEDKKIKLIEDYKNGTKAQAIVGCFENYNASFYDAWLLIVKYSGGSFALLPYKNGANNEFTEVDLDGTYYKLSDYSSGTYTSTQLTYTKGEIDTALNLKVDKTQEVNGHALIGNIAITKGDVGLGNVENYGIVNSPSADATNKYVDAGGLYTYLITNYADKSDYDTTKQKVNTMWAMFQDDGNDVVDTLYDLLKVFENFPETETIAPILSGIENRLDQLESMGNVVSNVGGATLLTSDWASNSDSYSTDYPYKATYQNDLLKGASNFSVIFSVDAVSMGLCPTAILDNTTGTITFYAEEIPSVDLDIENIVAFTTLNAINTLTTQTINQVQQNKNDISDINNVKLPQYAKLYNTQAIDICVVGDDYTNHLIGLGKTSVVLENIYKATSNKNLVSSVLLKDGKTKIINSTWESGSKTAEHTLEFDEDGDLKIDGNAVGGGKQLYQHNVRIFKADSNNAWNGMLQFINDSNEAMTSADILKFLFDNEYIKDTNNYDNYQQNMYRLTGVHRNYSGSQTGQLTGIVYASSTEVYIYELEGSNLGTTMVLSSMTITDTIIAL